MTIAPSTLLLSILRTEYETLAVGEWVTSRQVDVEYGGEVISPRKELDPRPLPRRFLKEIKDITPGVLGVRKWASWRVYREVG
jgi:hypothetical protein